MKKLNKKGFTLAELLVVVAIIAVLTAIAIPVFTAQLEKAREATDMANIRAAYAEVMTSKLTGDPASSEVTPAGGHFSKQVTLTQQTGGWQTQPGLPENLTSSTGAAQPTAGQTVTVTSNETGATIDILMTKAS